MTVGRHYDPGVQEGFKCRHQPLVFCCCTLEKYLFCRAVPVADNLIQIVLGHRIEDAAHDLGG